MGGTQNSGTVGVAGNFPGGGAAGAGTGAKQYAINEPTALPA